MGSAGKAGLGLGTSIAGGAATGAMFGPIGAGIGAGVGGLLGAIGMADTESEEELRHKRNQARKMAMVQALRNRGAQLGAPTAKLDMATQLQGIEDNYQNAVDQQNEVKPQDYIGLVQNLGSLGGSVNKWAGAPPKVPQGDLIRNSDLYGGSEGNTGLTQKGSDPYAPMDDPAGFKTDEDEAPWLFR